MYMQQKINFRDIISAENFLSAILGSAVKANSIIGLQD